MADEDDDRRIAAAERDASPQRFTEPFSSYDAGPPATTTTTQPVTTDAKAPVNGDAVPRAASLNSSSVSSSPASSIRHVPTERMSRVNTGRDVERHPTELGRIATHKSQHEGTVGKSVKSRESKRPLPNFGAGKPYPPALPEQEEYVVEFDGPDDPMHPQNWPMKKKCAHLLSRSR